MKFFSMVLFCFIMFFNSKANASGTSIGNGGVSVVCLKNSGEIDRAELFDLFESRALFGLIPVPAVGQNFFDIADEKISTFFQLIELSEYSNRDIYKARELFKKFIMLPPGVGLKLTEDVGHFILPKNCALSQLINYRHDGKIYVDQAVWNSLDETNKAAALVHEIVYSYLRKIAYQISLPSGETTSLENTSERVRKLVGHLFAGTHLKPIEAVIIKNESELIWTLWCETEKEINQKFGLTEFVVFRDKKNQTSARFRYINGRHMLSKTEVSFLEYGEGLEELSVESQIEDDAEFRFISFKKHPTHDGVMIPDQIHISQNNRQIFLSSKITCSLKTY